MLDGETEELSLAEMQLEGEWVTEENEDVSRSQVIQNIVSHFNSLSLIVTVASFSIGRYHNQIFIFTLFFFPIEKGLEKTKADGTEIREATTPRMLTKAGSDLNEIGSGVGGQWSNSKISKTQSLDRYKALKENSQLKMSLMFGLGQLSGW